MNEIQEYNINFPTKWEDITLETFVKLKDLYTEDKKPNMIEILSVISDKDIEYIRNIPATLFEIITDKLSFLSEEITREIDNKIIIDNITYSINTEQKLKTGEFVDAQMVNGNISAILGILCRKENEIYDDDFIANTLESRIEMFNKQPITNVQKIINFFLLSLQVSENTIQLYSENLKCQANLIVQNYINSLKNGLGRRQFWNWQMRKLKKLQKSLNNI